MIKATSLPQAFRTLCAAKNSEVMVDAPIEKGGGSVGFDPHELLEAAYAACINIVVRKRAVQLELPLGSVAVKVELHREQGDVATFEYRLDIQGSMTAEQRAQLFMAVEKCPVSQTLSRQIRFHRSERAVDEEGM
jgi:putative redox protein